MHLFQCIISVLALAASATLASEVVVCSDAGAGGVEQFPDVCRLADGRLMCVFNAGYAHVSPPDETYPNGGRVSYCTSSDEGRNWSAASILYDGPQDDRDPSITQLAGGRLLCSLFIYSNGVSEGTSLLVSQNGGSSWDGPDLIAPGYYVSSPVRELSDGRLILGLYKQEGAVAHGAVTFSDDNGDSWSSVVDIPSGGGWLDAETDVIELTNGILYATQRNSGFHSMKWSVSTDRGASWQTSQPIGYAGHCPYLYRATNDGQIVLHSYRSITAAGSAEFTGLRYSLDEAVTWSEAVEVGSASGYPSMVTLPDESILIVYYRGTDVVARRFCVNRYGVRWLDPYGAGADPELTVAWAPRPGDAAPAVSDRAVLSWAPGKYATTHDLYVGTNAADVANADNTWPIGTSVYKGNVPAYVPTGPRDINTATYDPGALQPGATYYWRVDEVSPADPGSPRTGAVWEFTVARPYTDYLGAGHWDDAAHDGTMTATAAQSYFPSRPENTVNGAGLSGSQHGTIWNTTMWLSTANGTNPHPGTEPGWTWIKYDFGRAYRLGPAWVWNYNQPPSSHYRGLRNVTVEYSTTGGTNASEWRKLGEYELAIGAGAATYEGSAAFDLGGRKARYVVITSHISDGSWGDTTYRGLSEIRFDIVPTPRGTIMRTH